MEKSATQVTGRGRPRSFDRDQALNAAMRQFWAHGYEGTSLAVLTAAMGITPPSLYAAFGNKEQLFLEAVRRYTGDVDELRGRLDAAPTAEQAVRAFLTDSAVTFTGSATPPGCLLASATASGSPASEAVQLAVSRVRAQTAALLRARLQRDITDGLLPADSDAATLANLAVCLTQGMSVLARDGASRKTLFALIDQAMLSWSGIPAPVAQNAHDDDRHPVTR